MATDFYRGIREQSQFDRAARFKAAEDIAGGISGYFEDKEKATKEARKLALEEKKLQRETEKADEDIKASRAKTGLEFYKEGLVPVEDQVSPATQAGAAFSAPVRERIYNEMQAAASPQMAVSAQPMQPTQAPQQGGIGGLLQQGNIDLNNRPRVQNPDGTISTVRSIGVNIDGRETLLPTVSDSGENLTPEQAVQNYRQTGKHLGQYSTVEEANAAAEQIHQQQAQAIGQQPIIQTGQESLKDIEKSLQPASLKPKEPETMVIGGVKVRRASGQARLTKDQKTIRDNLRDDLVKDKITQTTGALLISYAAGKAAMDSNSPFADMAITYNLMKAFDPNTGVKEGEFASASNTTSVPEKILNLYNKARTGNFLNGKQKREMFDEISRITNRQLDLQRGLNNIYVSRAEQDGLEAADIIIDYDKIKKEAFEKSIQPNGPTHNLLQKTGESPVKIEFGKIEPGRIVIQNGKRFRVLPGNKAEELPTKPGEIQ